MIYLATFHTHFGAVNFVRILKKRNVAGQMMPVPRSLSASCGVCVRFDLGDAPMDFSSEDLDSIYQEENGEHTLLRKED